MLLLGRKVLQVFKCLMKGVNKKKGIKERSKSKGEKERYKHLNAEFQRIARRDKKAFFRDQCKETEENNRMGKTRDQIRSDQSLSRV